MNITSFIISLFWKQNSHHQHGVLVHTLRVTWELFKAGHYKMLAAGLLHDIGKPGSAHQKPEDIINNEYSFTDHEESSYQVIKKWPFISDYTKNLTRHHYLIRRMSKAKAKGLVEYAQLKETWDSFSPEFQKDLAKFLACDDLGKGSESFRKNKKKD
jgi:putative nucleotidyltransferase with HDIG domain